MRGTHLPAGLAVACQRIIPAHAGNSRPPRSPARGASDHPRACGELATCPASITNPTGSSRACGELNTADAINTTNTGSSPRMRGTRGGGPPPWGHRIIPAHAGNSDLEVPGTRQLSDHPRACGELTSSRLWLFMSPGSSPRMRGTLPLKAILIVVCRIIPAHAGNSIEAFDFASLIPDHPRACGELSRRRSQAVEDSGSSPRMRGTPAPGLDART